MALPRESALAALRDPAYHRHLCFGRADARRASQLGRELLPHEAQARLPWPQLQMIRRVERAIADKRGEVLSIRSSRQTVKTETNAHLEDRTLLVHRGVPGSVWVRTAPTWRPQIINSKLRLEKFLACDPLMQGRWRSREGFIYECGHAQVQYLSGGASANIVGASATIALSVDEAHKIDRGKFQEDMLPFTASTNAPTVLWGVAADKLDLLHEYHERNRGTDRFLEFPADVWCELSPAYAAHYAERLLYLGADHPVILTQYRLVDVDSSGAFLSPAQRASLFSGDHPQLEQPRPGMLYYAVLDFGGEAEGEMVDEGLRAHDPSRDSTFGFIVEVDPRLPMEPYPEARVVSAAWYTGRAHWETLVWLKPWLLHWGISGGCADARGVGEAVAKALSKTFPCIVPYQATSESVSADCYDLHARLNTGRLKFWRADPAADKVRREVEQQTRHARYTIRGHQLMALVKPPGADSKGLHIDAIKALTYLRTALAGDEASAMLADMRADKALQDAATVAAKPEQPAGLQLTTKSGEVFHRG